MNKGYYYLIFILSGLLLVSAGFILGFLGYDWIKVIPISMGTTVISIVLVNFLWERSGGEPILKSLDILKRSSQIVSDSIETGLYKIYHNRRDIDYNLLNAEMGKANEAFILSLVFKVAQSLQLRESILKCVENGGTVRILISAPTIRTRGAQKAQVPLPLRLRQYAEQDLRNNRMPAEINDTIDYLRDIKKEVTDRFPSKTDNFEYSLLSTHVIYSSIIGIDQKIILTSYCNKQQGLGSPTMLIEKTNSPRSFYQIYKEEFEYLWKKAKSSTKV